jgi:hypothetical protein
MKHNAMRIFCSTAVLWLCFRIKDKKYEEEEMYETQGKSPVMEFYYKDDIIEDMLWFDLDVVYFTITIIFRIVDEK